MGKIKHVSDLGPIQLWRLRKDIVLNSVYLTHYENRYNIDEKEVYDFFMGFLQYIEECIKEDNPEISLYDLDNMWEDCLKDYDTPKHLLNWWFCWVG